MTRLHGVLAPAAVRHRGPTRNRVWRVVCWGVGTVLLAGFIVAVWPARWGGLVSLTIVSGTSMEPTYHSGDLVVGLRRHASVGDVIVYSPDDVEGNIVHRITGVSPDGGWITRGDENTWDDVWTPHQHNILGVVTWHVPGVARLVPTGPLLPIGLASLIFAVLVWPPRTTPSRNRQGIEP